MTENKSESSLNNSTKNDDQVLLDEVEALPKDERERVMATIEMYKGPIPHPEILKGYEKLFPGAAKEIITNGVNESVHRRNLETERQRRKGRLAWFSLISFAILSLVFMILSFDLINHDHKVIGSIFGGISFIGIFGSLINNVSELTKKDDLSSDENDKNSSNN
jgi:uncharacterized membrane protein